MSRPRLAEPRERQRQRRIEPWWERRITYLAQCGRHDVIEREKLKDMAKERQVSTR